jgi:hypothetical protein
MRKRSLRALHGRSITHQVLATAEAMAKPAAALQIVQQRQPASRLPKLGLPPCPTLSVLFIDSNSIVRGQAPNVTFRLDALPRRPAG